MFLEQTLVFQWFIVHGRLLTADLFLLSACVYPQIYYMCKNPLKHWNMSTNFWAFCAPFLFLIINCSLCLLRTDTQQQQLNEIFILFSYNSVNSSNLGVDQPVISFEKGFQSSPLNSTQAWSSMDSDQRCPHISTYPGGPFTCSRFSEGLPSPD